MSDLIDRMEAQAEMQQISERYSLAHEVHGWGTVEWSEDLVRLSDALCVLRKIPSIRPECKTGHWIDEGQYADYHSPHAYRCSECGTHIIEDNTDGDVFCRCCGARMESTISEWDVDHKELLRRIEKHKLERASGKTKVFVKMENNDG